MGMMMIIMKMRMRKLRTMIISMSMTLSLSVYLFDFLYLGPLRSFSFCNNFKQGQSIRKAEDIEMPNRSITICFVGIP